MYKKIYLDAPTLGSLEKKYLNKAIDNGYVSTVGPYVWEFESKFAKYLKVNKAIATQSGTASLHIALYELGLGEGDEIIVPALTFVATVNPVVYLGAKPVFVDVDIKTWNINPQEIRKKITPKTKAIIPVHFYGNPCDIAEIVKIAKENNLYIVEDATESLGSTYRRKYTGTFGELGCFSFNGNKTITTGGGGMVVGSDKKKLAHIEFLIKQAKDKSNSYYHPEVGFNYRMTNIEAALGLAQMEKLDEFIAKKIEINSIYRKELQDIKFINFQEEYKDAKSCWWISCIIFKKKKDISALQNKLAKIGIPTKRIFMPVVEFPPYKQPEKSEFRNSYYIYQRGLCLPSSTLNSRDDIHCVCRALKKFI